MTKDQAQKEFAKLIQQKIEEEEKIIKEAKEKGTWNQGLDSNKELFLELNAVFNKKIECLKAIIDEW